VDHAHGHEGVAVVVLDLGALMHVHDVFERQRVDAKMLGHRFERDGIGQTDDVEPAYGLVGADLQQLRQVSARSGPLVERSLAIGQQRERGRLRVGHAAQRARRRAGRGPVKRTIALDLSLVARHGHRPAAPSQRCAREPSA
jgi:hypothetical protein